MSKQHSPMPPPIHMASRPHIELLAESARPFITFAVLSEHYRLIDLLNEAVMSCPTDTSSNDVYHQHLLQAVKDFHNGLINASSEALYDASTSYDGIDPQCDGPINGPLYDDNGNLITTDQNTDDPNNDASIDQQTGTMIDDQHPELDDRILTLDEFIDTGYAIYHLDAIHNDGIHKNCDVYIRYVMDLYIDVHHSHDPLIRDTYSVTLDHSTFNLDLYLCEALLYRYYVECATASQGASK